MQVDENNKKSNLPIPEVPEAIIDAINQDKLVVFLGAGISRLIGCDSWEKQSEHIIEKCSKLNDGNGNSIINESQKKNLLNNFDPKKRITICSALLNESGFGDEFYDLLKSTVTADEEKTEKYNVYNELIKFRALFITTNFDEYFDRHFIPERIAYTPEKFAQKPDRNKLYKIHGTISEKTSIVSTVPQYLTQYNNTDHTNFLKKIFSECTILFIGYGMEEFELLDFIFLKNDNKTERELKHFILQRVKEGDEIKLYNIYYNQFGIDAIPYRIDDKSSPQLYYVIKKWASEINQKTNYMSKSFKRIKEIIDNFKNDSLDELFQYVKSDKSHKNHLYKILAETGNPLPWFEIFNEKDCFNPVNNPSPSESTERKGFFTIPSWQILRYLENVAKINKSEPDGQTTPLLIKIIDKFVEFQSDPDNAIDNNYTDWMMIKVIFSLPNDKIKDEYFKYLKSALKTRWDTYLIAEEIENTIFPALIEQKNTGQILCTLDIILDYYKSEKNVFEDISRIDPYVLNKILSKNKDEIGCLCCFDAAKTALKKVYEIVEQDSSQFNNVWIPAIENIDDFEREERYDLLIIKFIRDMLEKCEINNLRDLIGQLLRCDHPIFNRIAIYIINQHFVELSDLFWNINYNPLGKRQLEHECQELFETHNINISENEIACSQLMQWVKDDDIYHVYDDPSLSNEQKEEWLASAKLRWLLSFKNSQNDKIGRLYAEYTSICQYDPEEMKPHGEAIVSSISVSEISPITTQELEKKSIEEISNYLINFKDEGGFKKPSKYGLAGVFETFTENNPERILSNIYSFENIPLIYQKSILSGLNNFFKNNEIIKYESILFFISTLIESNKFWDDEMTNPERRDRDSLIYAICDIIDTGISNDIIFFDLNEKSLIYSILIKLATNSSQYIRSQEEFYSVPHFISSQQEVYRLIINYSTKDKKLAEDTKRILGEKLSITDLNSWEVRHIIGKYLPYLYNIDEKWVEKQVNNIFCEDLYSWKITFSGYLLTHKPTKKMFSFVNKHGDYARAINTFKEEKTVYQKLINHICLAYINGEDPLDNNNSLTYNVVEIKNTDLVITLIDTIWHIGKKNTLSSEQRKNIRKLWKYIFDKFLDVENNDNNKKIIGALFKWAIIFDEIDSELYDWLKRSTQYIHYGRINNFIFAKYLLNFIEKTPKEVGELLCIYIENGEFTFLHNKEDIVKITDYLYELGFSELADTIHNLALQRNEYFLNETFEKHHKNT